MLAPVKGSCSAGKACINKQICFFCPPHPERIRLKRLFEFNSNRESISPGFPSTIGTVSRLRRVLPVVCPGGAAERGHQSGVGQLAGRKSLDEVDECDRLTTGALWSRDAPILHRLLLHLLQHLNSPRP